jgi:hypothetical protein
MSGGPHPDLPTGFVRGRLLRALAVCLTFALVAFALATLRTLERGRAELALSDAAFDRGALVPAVQHARRAATAYVPRAVHVTRAYERLRAVARGAERGRDLANARAAWQAMRDAALESGHLWQPHAVERAEAERNLERLLIPSAPLDVFGAASAASPRRGVRALVLAAGLGSAALGLLAFVWLPRPAPGRWAHARSGGLVLLGVLCAALSLLWA